MAAKVFLINRQDKYCPENNNGDYIIEAWLNEEDAKVACDELDQRNPLWSHYINEMELGDKHWSRNEEKLANMEDADELISILVGDDK